MSKPAYRVDDVALTFRCEPDQEDIISALAERDYRIFEVEQPAGAIVPYHTHEEEETIILLDGRMQFNVEEELVLVGPGEMITIREGAIHAAAPVDNKMARLLIAFAGNGGAEPFPEGEWDTDEEDESSGTA